MNRDATPSALRRALEARLAALVEKEGGDKASLGSRLTNLVSLIAVPSLQTACGVPLPAVRIYSNSSFSALQDSEVSIGSRAFLAGVDIA